MSKDALRIYNQKRNFKVTSEPHGKIGRKRKRGLTFVVQKHAARALHYDFRLEVGGVMLSWAIPKGPSYDPADKRLAARTEDHPISYNNFEGIIPEKQYGAGPVMVWDMGTWLPLEEPVSAIKKGKLSFRLDGEKLHGEWTLARMNTKNKKENWLLIKSRDEEADKKKQKNFLNETDFSVISGRRFEEIKNEKKQTQQRREKKSKTTLKALAKQYEGIQLATLVDKPPHGKDWIHEVKYDGYRILAIVNEGKTLIKTRNGHDWTDKFPVLAKALETIKSENFVIDGEAVMVDENGLTNFKLLQNALGKSDEPMQGYFFDLLYWDGRNYLKEPLTKRRQALEKLFQSIGNNSVLFLSETIEGKAEKIIDNACDLGLEGIISKKKTASYTMSRSKNWLKSKCTKRQEFIIGGFIPASDRAKAVGALHLGYYKDGDLIYAGKVGTGFNHKNAREIYKDLKKIENAKHPFKSKPDGSLNQTIWVKPEKICEVSFAMWTKAGKIRHSSFQGMRSDKTPEDITLEIPKDKKNTMETDSSKIRKSREILDIMNVSISHPGREIFPKAKITKSELALFYAQMSKEIMPSVKNRPISVVRCPSGIDKQCFFQRSKGKGMPEDIERIDISHEGKKHDYMYIKNPKGLIGLIQMGVIEVHPWGVQKNKTEKPDRIIWDLDPDENVPFEAVKLAAKDIKKRLDQMGLKSFVKVTGGKGLHVTVPIQRRYDWDTVKKFSRGLAQSMVDELPDVYTINMSKSKRRGKIFIDYLRNDFASTAVMDYCVRARPGAPVAVPLEWKELEDLEAADQFHIKDVLKRKKIAGKLLQTMQACRQGLTKKIVEKFT